MSNAYATAKQSPRGVTGGRLDADVGNIVQFISQVTKSSSILSDPNRDVSVQTGISTQNAVSGSFDINESAIPPKLTASSAFPSVSDTFRALQKWEGYVIDVYEDTFLARLIPIRGEGSDQNAEIYIEEVEPADRALIEPGAVFYWSIGYLDRPSGRHRDSFIRFRRLPAWSQSELEAVRREAKRLKELLDVE